MPPAPIPLGPYDLRVPIGRGGMGEVWRAVYRPTNTPVALKVMRASAARRPELVACFHREVRAAATLDHPNIAPVLDAGEVDAATARALGGRLAAGSPFLVTELALGSLAGAAAPSSWVEVLPIVEDLLNALAHAHARGLTHRDLKPGNVLVAGTSAAREIGLPLGVGSLKGEERVRVMLADFGLAWTAREGRAEPDTASGTPPYMAPEQLDGRWRDIGPWTDVYGLGCLTWWLVAGRTPFQPRTIEAALLHHQHRALPALRPLFPVPAGLESWLVRMVARDPGARFPSAADAQHSLRALGEPAEPSDHEREGGDPDVTQPMSDVWRTSPSATPPTSWASADRNAAVLPAPVHAPPMPARPAPAGRPRPPLIGTGLSLFGLRPPPFIGRELQRDALWAELAAVRQDQRARVVVIHGPSGTGTSRLAAWLCESAAIGGAATPVKTTVSEDGLGLSHLIEAHLRAMGLRGAALVGRADAWMARHGYQDIRAASALATLVERGDDALDRHERFEALRVLVSVAARTRPVILWLDEAHEHEDALALAEHLLSTGGNLPLLVLLTARMDAMSRAPALLERLRDLLAAPLVREVTLGPLPPAQHRALVRYLLPLEPDLADRVEARTAGNPRFAEQLLSAWVRSDALVPGPTGFALRPGADEALPEEIHRAWERDLDDRLGAMPGEARECLALAALLGEPVDSRVWAASVAEAGLTLQPGLLTLLLGAGLIRPTPGIRGAFAFAHPMLRESLERSAAESGRSAALHRACATALGAGRSPGAAVRAGRHLLASGDVVEVQAALFDLAWRSHLRGAGPEGLALLNLREQSLNAAAAPDADLRWGQGWLLRAALLLDAQLPEEAERWADRVEAAARRHGWAALIEEGRRGRGLAAIQRGDLDRARAALEEDVEGRGTRRALMAAALLRLCQGAVGEATQLLDASRALTGAQASGTQGARDAAHDALLDAREHLMRGRVALALGQNALGRAEFRRSLERFRAMGNHVGEAWSLAGLARVARAEGLYARAEGRLREAIGLGEVAGSSLGCVLAVSLAVTHLFQDQPSRARVAVADVLDPLLRLGLDGDLAKARLVLAAAAAFEGDWATWDHQMREDADAVELHHCYSHERQVTLELVQARALATGEVERARRVELRLSRIRATVAGPAENAEQAAAAQDRIAG